MVAPYTKTQEVDQSYRVSGSTGVATGIVVAAKKGPTIPTLISSDTEYLKYYTENEAVEVGDTLAHFSALSVLNKSDSLWVQRAVPEDALYGGVVLKTVSGTSEQLSIGLKDPTAYLFKDVAGTLSPQISEVSFAACIEGSLSGTYFVLPGAKQYVWYKIAGNKLKASYTVTDAENLAVEDGYAKYIMLPGSKQYVYFVVDGKGSDPELTDLTAIKAELEAGATSTQVARAFANALSGISGFTATSSSNKVSIESAEETEDGDAGTTDFIYITEQEATDSSSDPAPTSPYGMTGIAVEINANETVAEVARKTFVKLNTSAKEFKCTYEDNSAVVTITHSVGGSITEIADGDTNFDFTTTQYGGEDTGVPCLLIYGANQGKWNNNIVVKIYNYTDYPSTVGEKNAFLIKVFKSSNLNTELESWLCSLDPSHLDGSGNSLYVETVLEGSYYIRGLVNAAVSADQLPASEAKGTSLKGGSDGSPVTDASMIKAVKKFANKDEIKITLLIDGGWATPAYHTEMLRIAKERQDCFAILSTPVSAESSADYKNALVNYRKNQLNANTSYGALITPHVKVFDYFNNRDIWAAPDGQLAGALIDADRNYEIWYPVLGFRRGVLDVTDVKRTFESGDLNYLYDNGLNPIRKTSGKGIVIWGQKTLQSGASALDRINVRMMLIRIEPAIEEYLENYIGEFNDSQTRSEITTIVEDYLTDIQARRGISEFKCVCDTTNNTAQVISNNELIIWTYVKPLYSAEFITNKLIITAEGVSLT
jgi:hypothetical protein